jgi:Tfp pilus assembly major pilin PilA
MEPTDTHHDVNAEQTMAYLDTIDQMKATEEPSSTRPSDLCTQSHHMKQNMDMSPLSNNQYMSATDTQVQQFNQADYINFHTNHTNSSNRLYTDNNHYHDTALSSSTNNITSFHIDPTVQITGGTEYNMHWKPADPIHDNLTSAQQDICHDNVH